MLALTEGYTNHLQQLTRILSHCHYANHMLSLSSVGVCVYSCLSIKARNL